MVKKSQSKAKPPKKPGKATARPEQSQPRRDTRNGEAADKAAAEEKQSLKEPQPQQQQRLLDVFRAAFSDVLGDGARLAAALQEVKQALFNRDFAAAFARPDLLDAYAARWSPTRALCYADVLRRVAGTRLAEENGDERPGLRVVCLGGGAAEIVALGALFLDDRRKLPSVSAVLVDAAPWGDVVRRLHSALGTDESLLSATFVRGDVLDVGRDGWTAHFGGGAGEPNDTAPPPRLLLTLLFTLNELFTAGGVRRTTALLLDLSTAAPPGSLLLVVDSPGSYSEAVVGSGARRYPMQWLLDHILLGGGGGGGGEEDGSEVVEGRRWTKLEGRDSVWCRLPAGLEYPIPLEDMRYQMHLYRLDEANSGGKTT